MFLFMQAREQVVYLAERAREPIILGSLSATDVKGFLEEYDQYQAGGGRKPWTAFISSGLRSFISYSVFERPPTDDQLLEYLRQLAQQTPANLADIKKR